MCIGLLDRLKHYAMWSRSITGNGAESCGIVEAIEQVPGTAEE